MGILLGIVNIVIPATSPATNLAKTVAKPSYKYIEYLHGMQGAAVRVRLAPSVFLLGTLISLNYFTWCIFKSIYV